MARKTELSFVLAPGWPQEVKYGGEHFFVVGRFHFLVESKTEKDSYHCLDLEGVPGEVGKCTCRSGETRKTCRHETTVRRWVGLPA